MISSTVGDALRDSLPYITAMLAVTVGLTTLLRTWMDRLERRSKSSRSAALAASKRLERLISKEQRASGGAVDTVSPEANPTSSEAVDAGSPAADRTPGEEAIEVFVVEFRGDLTAEATRVAKGARAERPSAAHVREAADRIRASRGNASVLTDVLYGFGSICVGAAASYLVTTGSFNPASTFSLTVGGVAFAFALGNKTRSF